MKAVAWSERKHTACCRGTRKDKSLGDINVDAVASIGISLFIFNPEGGIRVNSIWNKVLEPGEKWSGSIQRGCSIQFTALEDGANLSLLAYNARDLSERYNMPDTLKAQHTFYLTEGNVMMSDNGRVLASVTEDTLGWHDTVSGYTSKAWTDQHHGKTSYQEWRNEWNRNGEENFVVELVRNGMGVRDLTANVNLFSKVYIDEAGGMHYETDHCRAGSAVTLRAEMDVLFILSNTPNPLNPASRYPSVPIKVEAFEGTPAGPDDECVMRCPENRRAFENTWDYQLLVGK